MNPSNLTSATAAAHVDDLRTAACNARLASRARGCRDTAVDRVARALHLSRPGTGACTP